MVASKAARSRRRVDAAERPAPPTVAAQWTRPFLAIALLVAVGLVAGMAVSLWRAQVTDAGRLAGWAETVQQQLSHRVEQLQRTLQQWGQDEELARLLATDDEAALVRKVAELRRALPTALPAALAIHVRSRAAALAPATEDPDLSFAGRDLVRQAAQSDRVTLLEVHRVGQPQRHLAIAGPLHGGPDGGVAGVLYLALPMSALPETGVGIPGLGRIGYQQRIDDALVTIDAGAGGAAPQRSPDHSVPVPGTRLAVAVWHEPAGVLDPIRLAGPIGLYLLLLALVGLVLASAYRRLDRTLTQDLAAILAMIEEGLARRPVREPLVQLNATWQLAEHLLPRLRRLASGSAIAAAPADAQPAGPQPSAAGVEVTEQDEDSEDLAAELEALLAKHAAPPAPMASPVPPVRRPDAVAPAALFRLPHIGGRSGTELTEGLAAEIGRALGSEAQGRDGRTFYLGHAPCAAAQTLATALGDGLLASGCDVVDLGEVPTPLVYFAACRGEPLCGVMVTAGGAPEQVGIQALLNGRPLLEDGLGALRERILREDFAAGAGTQRAEDLREAYLARIDQDVALARTLKVVVCGHGPAGELASVLYRRLGCQVPGSEGAAAPGDGEGLDPARPASLHALAQRVVAEQADLGLAFDDDGDRLGVVASDGTFVAADRILTLLAEDVLSRHLGADVIFDAACSRHLSAVVQRHGGRALMWRSEPASLMAKVRETGAPIAGALRGHFIFAERWLGVADALYAGARLLELLALDPRPSAEVFATLPAAVATPELALSLADGEADRILATLHELALRCEGAELKRVDGLRVELDRGWGLVRPAPLGGGLALRFEGEDEAALAAMQALFRQWLEVVAPGLPLPF